MGRPVDHQPLDLMKHRRVRRIVVHAEGAAGDDDADRRLLRHHRADLNGRGVGAQHEPGAVRPLGKIERVVLLARRVLEGDVKRGEIVEILLDMRAFGDRETHFAKDRHDLVDRLADRMKPPCGGEGHREGRIGALTGEPLFERGPPEPRGGLAERRRDAVLGGVQRGAGAPALFRLERAQFAHRQGERPTPSEHPDTQLLQRFRGRCGGDLGKDRIRREVEICHSIVLTNKRPRPPWL